MNPDTEASQWITRRRNGLAPEEEAELTSWLERDSVNREAFERISKMSEVLERAVRRGAVGSILGEVRLREKYRRFRRRTLMAAAALVAVALAIGYRARTKTAAGEGPSPLVWAETNSLWRLPDGSIADMDQGAEIAVRYETGARKVELLRGEAVFHVEKDPARPFLVRAGRVEVRAVGTVFSVELALHQVDVLVTEGRVGVENATGGGSILPGKSLGEPPVLMAGQEALVNFSGQGAPAVRVRSIALAEMKTRLAWRIPRMEFDGLALGQAIERMNRQNRLQIRINDDSIRDIRISGAFMPDDPETFARLIAETFDLESVRESESQILLRRK